MPLFAIDLFVLFSSEIPSSSPRSGIELRLKLRVGHAVHDGQDLIEPLLVVEVETVREGVDDCELDLIVVD